MKKLTLLAALTALVALGTSCEGQPRYVVVSGSTDSVPSVFVLDNETEELCYYTAKSLLKYDLGSIGPMEAGLWCRPLKKPDISIPLDGADESS